MVHITNDRDVCTVIVTVEAEPDVLETVAAHARAGVTTHFGQCAGFIAGAVHVSADGTRLVQYVQWETEAAYVRCRDDPKWETLPTTIQFMEHAASGRTRVAVHVYDVVGTSGS